MELETQIELAKQRLADHDTALDKLGDISSSLKEIVIEHKEKLKRTDELITRHEILDDQRFQNLKNDLSSDITNIHEALKGQLEAVLDGQEKVSKKFEDVVEKITNRVSVLETYRWKTWGLIVGGAAVIGYLINWGWEFYKISKTISP